MAFTRDKVDHKFPSIPSSLSAAGHDIDNHELFLKNLSPTRPYLGLRARLSQVWINRWTVLTVLVLCRFLLATRDLNYNIGRAKEEALEACTSVESVGSAMASMPHYLSRGVNSLAVDTVTRAVDELMEMAMDTVDLVSNIVLFVINMFTQTYACLITFAVTGSLSASIELIEKVGRFMNESIGAATDVLAKDIKGFQDGFDNFMKKIKIPPVFGKTVPVPKIDLSGPIDSLHKIKIDPTEMNAELNKLNASLPNFADVQKFTENAIKFPFYQLQKRINESKVGYNFDHNIFPVAEKKKLTFCSDNTKINDFFNEVLTVVYKARTTFTVALIILAILFTIFAGFQEIHTWRRLQDQNKIQAKADHTKDLVELMYIFFRPNTSMIGIHIATKLFTSIKQRNLVRWFIAYGTTPAALYVLSLGTAGLFSCLCQFILLKTVQREVPVVANEVGKFAEIVVKSLDDASKQWAVDSNNAISKVNMKINNDVFGWVHSGTEAINGTIDQFTNEMTKTLNTVFGGTVLYQPIKEVMNCLVGLKIASVQRGLTWVHDKAHVNIPPFKSDVFSLGAATSLATSHSSDNSESFLASTGNITTDKITSAIEKVVNKLQENTEQEALISAGLIATWIIVVLMGSGRVIFESLRRVKVRGEGGPPSYSDESYQSPENKSKRIQLTWNRRFIKSSNRTHHEDNERAHHNDDEKNENSVPSVGYQKLAKIIFARKSHNAGVDGSLNEKMF